MKRYFYLCTAALMLLAAGCYDDHDNSGVPGDNQGDEQLHVTDIVLLNEKVSLGPNTEGRLNFTLNPADAVVDLIIEGENANLKLVAADDGNHDAISTNYTLTEVVSSVEDSGETTQYTAIIKDMGVSTEYTDNVKLVLTITDQKGEQRQVYSPAIEISYGSGTELFAVKINGIEAMKSDESTFHIKLPYGTEVTKLTPEFLTNGTSVRTKENSDEDMETATADFSTPVTFEVVSSDGQTQEYKVVVHYSELPILYITTPAAITSKDNWVEACNIEIWNAGELNGVYQNANIKGRGNTTWNYKKKPYAIKLDKKAEVLGMPKHKRWVLLANFLDITCMRNAVAFEIARNLSGLSWTPRGQFVEVVMNGQFLGNYYLCEHIKVDENRVDITEIDPADTDEESVTGGYIFELDTYYDEAFKFRTNYRNLPVQFKDPDEDIATEQMNYVQNYFNKVEEILYGENGATEDVFDYIDMDSFIDWWFVYELARNGEPNHPKSSYMHKDRGGKLMAGPVWDFDYGTFKPTTAKFIISSAIWYTPLFKHETFVARVKERWAAHRSRLEQITTFIDETAAYIQESAEANHVLWPNSAYDSVNADTGLSFTEAVARIKSAYLQRMESLDSAIAGM